MRILGFTPGQIETMLGLGRPTEHIGRYDPQCCPPPPNPPAITLDGLKRELSDLDTRKAKLESMIAYIETNPGALDVLHEIARR